MKNKLLLTLCLLCVVQLFGQSKVNPGIRGGWTMSTVTDLGSDYRNNFYLGLQLPITLSSFYKLQPEVNYTRQGTNNIKTYNSEYIGNLSLDYIDLNMINKFSFGKMNLQVGPGLAFLTNASETGVTKIDLTFNLGVGIEVTSRLGIEARWKPGLINIDNDIRSLYSTHDYYYYDYFTNNVFQIGAYFTL